MLVIKHALVTSWVYVVGKYRRYSRKRMRPGRKLRNLLPYVVVVSAVFYALLTLSVSIPIAGKLLDYSVNGVRVVNATLYRITYLAPSSGFNRSVRLYLDGASADFSVPEGREGDVVVLGDSRLIPVEDDIVYPRIVVPGYGVNTTYPGPPINTTFVGRSEDYIVSHFPVELYFVFTVQLCNVTVTARPAGPQIDGLRVTYLDREDAAPKEAAVTCQRDGCVGYLGSSCILSYSIASDLSYFNFVRLRAEDDRVVLRLVDNVWLPSSLFAVTVVAVFLLSRKYSTRGGTRESPRPRRA